MPEHGPFSSEQEAAATAAVRQARAAWYAIVASGVRPVAGKHIPLHLQIMTDALTAARVELTAYELGTFRWLANYEDTTCQVIAGVIERAYQAGLAAAVTTPSGENL